MVGVQGWGRMLGVTIALLLTLLATVGGAQAGSGGRTIPPEAFGIHSFHGRPDIPAGAIRLNCSPPWYQVNPAPGVWEWPDADRRMISADSWVGDVMYVFCGTPLWAAAAIDRPDENWYGEGTNAPPRRMSYWRDYVTAIVDRYGDVVDAYQMWNEANSRFMWRGTPRMMARMTVVAADIIEQRDPTATIVAPSVQLTVADSHRQFLREYLAVLARHEWPIDVISMHTYVQGNESVGVRVTRARSAIAFVRGLGLPARVRFWDTETNVLRDVSGTRQAAFVARSFLDSWRSGVTRTYWYHYTFKRDDFVGIEMRPGDISESAYRAIVNWTVRARYFGCAQRFGVVSCRFESPAGRPFRIVYARNLTQPFRLGGRSRTCVLLASSCRVREGWIRVGPTPVRVHADKHH